MDYFKKFIYDEYDWIFDFGTDTSAVMLDEFKDDITEEEFDSNFEIFKIEATKKYINDEYYIQQLHEQMDDCFREVLNEYVDNKSEFIENCKLTNDYINKEIREEITNAYKTLKRYPIAKDIVKELADKDNTCPEWLKDVIK